jgi:hypothetical protein
MEMEGVGGLGTPVRVDEVFDLATVVALMIAVLIASCIRDYGRSPKAMWDPRNSFQLYPHHVLVN